LSPAARRLPRSPLFPYTTLFRSAEGAATLGLGAEKGTGRGSWVRKMCTDANGKRSGVVIWAARPAAPNTTDLAQQALNSTALPLDRKSTRLNSSHVAISYAVFCL